MNRGNIRKELSKSELFTEVNENKFRIQYVELIEKILPTLMKEDSSFTDKNIFVSNKALASAISDIRKDVNIIVFRRCHPNISVGKYAGIIAFRLARANILSVNTPLNENIYALRLNTTVAFAYALRFGLRIDIAFLPETVSKELQYTIHKRHTNQETLGVCFDAIIELSKQNRPPQETVA